MSHQSAPVPGPPLAAGGRSPPPPARRTISARVMRRGVGRCACGCSTAATANVPRSIAAIRQRPRQPARRAQTCARRRRSPICLAGLRAAEARRHRPCGAEGHRTGRRGLIQPVITERTNADRVEHGPARRHRQSRPPNNASGSPCPLCTRRARCMAVLGALGARPPAVRRRRTRRRARHRPARRTAPRCWSGRKAASTPAELERCGRVPL